MNKPQCCIICTLTVLLEFCLLTIFYIKIFLFLLTLEESEGQYIENWNAALYWSWLVRPPRDVRTPPWADEGSAEDHRTARTPLSCNMAASECNSPTWWPHWDGVLLFSSSLSRTRTLLLHQVRPCLFEGKINVVVLRKIGGSKFSVKCCYSFQTCLCSWKQFVTNCSFGMAVRYSPLLLQVPLSGFVTELS